jgi:hypothetical protein
VGQSGVVGRCQIPEDKKPKERKEKNLSTSLIQIQILFGRK